MHKFNSYFVIMKINVFATTADHLLNGHGGKSDRHNEERSNVMRGEIHFPSLKTNPTPKRKTRREKAGKVKEVVCMLESL